MREEEVRWKGRQEGEEEEEEGIQQGSKGGRRRVSTGAQREPSPRLSHELRYVMKRRMNQ